MAFFAKIPTSKTMPITAINGNYTATSTDSILSCDTSSNSLTITLPSISDTVNGKTYIIKDVGGSANTNNITINSASTSEFIDAGTSYTISTVYGCVGLYCNNGNWWSIIHKYTA